MGAAESIRQPLISKQLPLHPIPVWMASVPGMPSVHTRSCWSQLPAQSLAQTSSVTAEVRTELLTALPTQPEGLVGRNPTRILRVFANCFVMEEKIVWMLMMFICWGWRKGNHSTSHRRHPAAMPECGIKRRFWDLQGPVKGRTRSSRFTKVSGLEKGWRVLLNWK